MTQRVLQLINGEYYAGAERVQDLLALRLPELGYAAGFACLKNGIFADRRKSRDAAIYSFPMRSKLDFAQASRLAGLVKREHYRLIHTHTRRAALIGELVSMISGVPMVHHLHSPSNEDTENRWRNMQNTVAEKVSLLCAKKLIPVSGSLEEYLLERGYAPKRIRTVWNGVPIQDRTRRSSVPGEPVTVGTVALFRPRKGIEILLEALAALRHAGLDLRLHAVGPFESPDYRESVLRGVRELGLADHVHWCGFVDDVPAEFAKMHVFVLPSLFGEGMPMVMLEAMAAGLPVIGTRVEGIPEVVRDGYDGLLVTPGSVNELADALRQLTVDDNAARTFGDRGWRRQREAFSDLSMARGVAAVYEEVLDR